MVSLSQNNPVMVRLFVHQRKTKGMMPLIKKQTCRPAGEHYHSILFMLEIFSVEFMNREEQFAEASQRALRLCLYFVFQLTPFSLKRKVVVERYKNEVEQLFTDN